MAIKKVIFDVGQVLVKFSPKNLFLKILKNEEEVDYFLKKYLHMGMAYSTRLGLRYKQSG